MVAFSQPPSKRTYQHRNRGYLLNPQQPAQAHVLKPMKTAADCAAALGAVRISTEDAWFNASDKIRRVVPEIVGIWISLYTPQKGQHSCGLAGGTRIALEIPWLTSNLGYRKP
jgi:hypothetical protein